MMVRRGNATLAMHTKRRPTKLNSALPNDDMLVPATTGSRVMPSSADTASLALVAKNIATRATEKSGSAARSVIASETGIYDIDALREPNPATKHIARAHRFFHGAPCTSAPPVACADVVDAEAMDTSFIKPVLRSNAHAAIVSCTNVSKNEFGGRPDLRICLLPDVQTASKVPTRKVHRKGKVYR